PLALIQHSDFCITTLRPRLHRCSTRHQLFLAEISTVAVYFPCAFTTCLRPHGYPRRPGRTEMGLWCLPSLIPPPFRVRHLTYATSCRTNGLQSKPARTAINGNLGRHYGGWQRALITASATLHPLSLSHCSSRRTEGRRGDLDGL